jgi:putative membrane protein
MIAYNPKSWLKLIFALHKSDTLRMLWKELLYMMAFTLLIDFVVMHFFPNAIVLEKLLGLYSVIGFVLSLLLVFRTNTAYDRWWEGRKNWGKFVNDSRNLASKLQANKLNRDELDFFARMIPNFVFASKEHLRNGVKMEELELLDEEYKFVESREHKPAAIIDLINRRLIDLREDESISLESYLAIENNVNGFLDNHGACERIKNTPIPFSYSLFLKKFIFIYVTTLPLAFITSFGFYSAFIATFVFYVLVSIEVLAEEIEDPFGTDDNDLPTDSIAEKIRANVKEILS